MLDKFYGWVVLGESEDGNLEILAEAKDEPWTSPSDLQALFSLSATARAANAEAEINSNVYFAPHDDIVKMAAGDVRGFSAEDQELAQRALESHPSVNLA